MNMDVCCCAYVVRALYQFPIRSLFVRPCKVWEGRDLYLKLSDRSEIWQAPRKHYCRCACQMSKLCDNLKYQTCRFETTWDFRIRRPIGYWNGVQAPAYDVLFTCVPLLLTIDIIFVCICDWICTVFMILCQKRLSKIVQTYYISF